MATTTAENQSPDIKARGWLRELSSLSRSCRIQATRQNREDTWLTLFVSVVIEWLGSIWKQFRPYKWRNDRCVSPAEVSAILMLTPEKWHLRNTVERESESFGQERSKEPSAVGDNADDLVRRTSKLWQPPILRYRMNHRRYNLCFFFRHNKWWVISSEFLLDQAVHSIMLISRKLDWER